jgi:tetratricopeptide (TPR) repeat protein
MNWLKLICCSLLTAFFALQVCAQSETALFATANQAYAKAQYAEAIEKYEKVASQGFASSELFFNLGNAYYKSKNYPKAILNFEKAVKLNPHDDDANFNLKLANKMKVDKIESLPEVFTQKIYEGILGILSPNQWAYMACICVWLLVVGLAFFMLSRNSNYKRMGLLCSLVFLFFTLTSTGLAYLAKRNVEENKYVKSAPETSGADLYLLHEGTKLKVLDEIGGWRKVKLADGKTGWLEEASMEDI